VQLVVERYSSQVATWLTHPSAHATALSIGKAALRSLNFCLAEELEPHGIHVATVTIMGYIQSGTQFDPDCIAETYWQLYMQPTDQWEREHIVAYTP
jgi:NAD(P)-dependent dehydrogenase (short-subunit alcohol dehydrogenase family)